MGDPWAQGKATPADWDCPVVRWHRPKARVRQGHHAWPLYLGGPDKGVKVGICGSCHDMTHVLMDRALAAGMTTLLPAMHLGFPARVTDLALYGLQCYGEHRQITPQGWMVGARMLEGEAA